MSVPPASGAKLEVNILQEMVVLVLFGWNIGVLNVICGGRCGYSGGNVRCARKKPPEKEPSAFYSLRLCRDTQKEGGVLYTPP